MSPPGRSAAPRSGGTTSAEAKSPTEQAIRAAHAILGSNGLEMSPSKISRLVRRFAFRVENNGWSFFEFFTNAIRLTADQRRQAIADPDVRVFAYWWDPTGEDAATHVDRERGW
jgi:hypothetical protein